jgi:hypothetical protein
MGGTVIDGNAKQMLMHNPSALNGGDIGGVARLLVAFAGAQAMVSIRVVEME